MSGTVEDPATGSAATPLAALLLSLKKDSEHKVTIVQGVEMGRPSLLLCAAKRGADGIRANAVNADRIRSGLLTDDFIKERSKARGLSEKDYMSGNLLGREVTADDVAQAFLHQALELKTTGDVTTVDGGNIAAALR